MSTLKNKNNSQINASSAVALPAPAPLTEAQTETITNLVLGGDLSKMDGPARVRYYVQLCESLHLNPLTQPFQILRLSGKEVLYATKSCTEQLRKLQGVSVTKLEPRAEGEVYLVVASVQDASGRLDAATGAVPVRGLSGENLANAFMKAETKAKRRATLSLCGLGILDESELDTLPQAQRVSLPAAPEIGTSATLVAESPAKPAAGNAPAATASTSPAPSTTSGPKNEAEPAGEFLTKIRAKLLAARSKLELKELYNSLTAGLQAALQEEFTAARLRIEAAIAHAAATVAREAPAAMKEAGDDSALVDEFVSQPVVPGRGPAVEYATGEQRQTIQRLLNHVTITRKEKTALLLVLNKLDQERARQALLRLRTAIAEREGLDPREGSRAQLKHLVVHEGHKLPTEYAAQLLALAENPAATLEELTEIGEQVQAWLLDEDTYGSEAELAAADTALAA